MTYTGGEGMDVAKLSMAYSAAKIQNEVSVLALKKVMDVSMASATSLIEGMGKEMAVGVDPDRGRLIDVRV